LVLVVPSVGPGLFAQAKLAVAAGLGVSPVAVEITFRD
jgi:hypothetical protein